MSSRAYKAISNLAVYIKNLRRADGGASLVEVLVALAVFSLVVVAFVAYFMSTFTIVHIAAKKSESVFMAQAETEELIDTIVGDEDALRVDFPDSSVTVEGKIVQVEERDNLGRVVRLEVFVPPVPEQNVGD